MARKNSSHVVTERNRNTVRMLSGYGIPQDQIAAEIGVSLHTLERHYRADLDEGIRKANSLVVQNLHRQATKDSPNAVTAAIWWTKSRMQWRRSTTSMSPSNVIRPSFRTRNWQ